MPDPSFGASCRGATRGAQQFRDFGDDSRSRIISLICSGPRPLLRHPCVLAQSCSFFFLNLQMIMTICAATFLFQKTGSCSSSLLFFPLREKILIGTIERGVPPRGVRQKHIRGRAAQRSWHMVRVFPYVTAKTRHSDTCPTGLRTPCVWKRFPTALPLCGTPPLRLFQNDHLCSRSFAREFWSWWSPAFAFSMLSCHFCTFAWSQQTEIYPVQNWSLEVPEAPSSRPQLLCWIKFLGARILAGTELRFPTS